MFSRHSHIAHAAYHDLLRLLKDDRLSDLRGTPTRVVRDSKIYWYDSYSRQRILMALAPK